MHNLSPSYDFCKTFFYVTVNITNANVNNNAFSNGTGRSTAPAIMTHGELFMLLIDFARDYHLGEQIILRIDCSYHLRSQSFSSFDIAIAAIALRDA